MSEPQPTIQPNPFQPLPPEKKGVPTWAIVLIAVFGASAVLCVVAGLVIVGILTVLGGQVSQVFNRIDTQIQEGTSPVATAAPVATTGASTIGQAVTSGNFELVVTSAKPITAAEGDLPPSAGKTYYAVEVRARNTAANDANLSGFDTRVQDAMGNVSEASLFGISQSAASNLFQSVPPGQTVTATYVYEVSTDASELFWVYQSSDAAPVVVQVR